MLTVEQKINMLILAGYEPMVFSGVMGESRVCTENGMLYRTRDWAFVAGEIRTGGYDPAHWDTLDLASCPDELIYQAMEAANGR